MIDPAARTIAVCARLRADARWHLAEVLTALHDLAAADEDRRAAYVGIADQIYAARSMLREPEDKP